MMGGHSPQALLEEQAKFRLPFGDRVARVSDVFERLAALIANPVELH
jgi:hypothetical protein